MGRGGGGSGGPGLGCRLRNASQIMRQRVLKHLSHGEKGQPGPISDGVSRVACGSLMNPLLKYPRSGDGVGRLVCPPLTAAHSCSRLPHQQLLELPSALAGLHFHSVASPLTSPLLSAFSMRPLVGRLSPWRALALTLGPRTPPVPTCCPHLPLVDPTPAWSWLPFQHFFESLHLLR